MRIFVFILIFFTVSCSQQVKTPEEELTSKSQADLFLLLERTSITDEQNFAILKNIAENYKASNLDTELILFLTDHVARNPNDPYNAYWLLLTANTYLKQNANPLAEMYYERIIKNYSDLSIEGQSIHMICLQNLLQLSTNAQNRIEYLLQLITHFPEQINKTEYYARLAKEYETNKEWDLALKTHSIFLEQNDAAEIQIEGIPDAYTKARTQVDFHNSAKDWTFETLEELEDAVKYALRNYQYWKLEKYRSKVNFFAMSWSHTTEGTNKLGVNAEVNFLISDYASGKRIYYNKELDTSSTQDEAYLRTWGWRQYVDIWYLYFRKVNFPQNPEIHGRWEWAGIYYGEKL